MRSRTWIGIIGLALGVVVVSEVGDAWARARGGGGGGSSRGSRSYSAPARPSSPASPTTPSSPSRSLNQPAAPAASPSFFGRGLMGGIAGFALGGLLGSMLFGGMGHGMGGFGGIGLMDILLIGGGLALLFMFLRRRRAEQQQPAYAGMGGAYRTQAEPVPAPTATVTAAPVEISDVDRGIAHIAQMDGGFDTNRLVSTARDLFFDVQAAVTARDLSRVREKLTPEIATQLQSQVDELRGARRTNRVERVDVRRSEITEAWQESGRDYVTVYFTGSLLDYTVDDTSGAVVAGSATQPENLEEFWTFTRPVGPNAWRLSAIQSA